MVITGDDKVRVSSTSVGISGSSRVNSSGLALPRGDETRSPLSTSGPKGAEAKGKSLGTPLPPRRFRRAEEASTAKGLTSSTSYAVPSPAVVESARAAWTGFPAALFPEARREGLALALRECECQGERWLPGLRARSPRGRGGEQLIPAGRSRGRERGAGLLDLPL